MFAHGAGTVGIEELFEGVDLLEEFLAFVGVFDAYPSSGEVLKECAAMDIGAGEDGLFTRFERLMLDELDTMAIIDKGISGDARFLLIGFGEAAVDDETLAVGADRRFSFDGANGYMSVNDTSRRRIKTEFPKNIFAYFLIVCEGEIGALFLVMRIKRDG